MAINTNDTTNILLPIEGANCPICAKKIEDAVTKIHGVSQVKMDLENKILSFQLDDNGNLMDIKDCINKLGYNA